VAIGTGKVELILEKRSSAAGVYDPPAAHGERFSRTRNSDCMVRVTVAKRDLDYLASIYEVDSGSQDLTRQPGLEATAIDLVTRNGQEVAGAALEPAGNIAVPVVAHEEAQPKLTELVAEQI
jgi:hypothetical protein